MVLIMKCLALILVVSALISKWQTRNWIEVFAFDLFYKNEYIANKAQLQEVLAKFDVFEYKDYPSLLSNPQKCSAAMLFT